MVFCAWPAVLFDAVDARVVLAGEKGGGSFYSSSIARVNEVLGNIDSNDFGL